MLNLGAQFKVKESKPTTAQIKKSKALNKETQQWINKAAGVRRYAVMSAELKKLIKTILLKKDSVPQVLKIATTIFDAANKANDATLNKASEYMTKIKGKSVKAKTVEYFDLIVRAALKAGITISKYDIDQLYQMWRKTANKIFTLMMSIATIPAAEMTADDQKKLKALQSLLSTDIKKKAPKKKAKPKAKTPKKKVVPKKKTVPKKKVPKKKVPPKVLNPEYPRYEGQAERQVNKQRYA